MELFIALGMEMGSWLEDGEPKYFVRLSEDTIELTSKEYDLWLLAQQASFTPKSAAEYMEEEEGVLRERLEGLVRKCVVMYWTEELSAEKLVHYSLTPRGNAGELAEDGQQLLNSSSHADPVKVDTFGHALWMMSNSLVTLDIVILHVSENLDLELSKAYLNSAYWIPYLIRHGLAVLNPSYIGGSSLPCGTK